jgi:hypothetical protein
MKRLMILLAGILIGATTAICTAHAQKKELPPGMLPYTPTRVEWLALNLQANYKTDWSPDSDYSVNFIPDFPDTIAIAVGYTDKASAALVDQAVEGAKALVGKEANNFGWSKWVKIKVDRSSIK